MISRGSQTKSFHFRHNGMTGRIVVGINLSEVFGLHQIVDVCISSSEARVANSGKQLLNRQ